MTRFADTLRRVSGAVEDFRGDYDELAAMMQASWAENPNPPYLYTSELLADFFRYPGSSFALAPSVYRGSALVAFVAGHPRRVMVGEIERRILISTFLTVAPAHKNSGYGILVWSDLMRRAADAGFDGVLTYCADGEAMHRMIGETCRRLGLPLVCVKSFSYLVRSLDGPSSGSPPSEPAAARDLITAAAALRKQTQLGRLWSEPEAAWQLSRLGAVSIRVTTDADPAILTGAVLTVADEDRTRYLVIDDVLWGDLRAASSRQTAVHALLGEAVDQGARYAIVPLLGYADLRPFVATGFRPAAHTIHAYLALWNGPAPAGPAERYYLDVI